MTAGAAEPDLWIRYDQVPERLEAARTETPFWDAAPDRVLLRLAGVGRYLIQHGREILVEPEPIATAKEVRLFLLGSSLGAAMQQRGRLLLHASVVIAGGQAVAFLGPSGRGKSSLAAALAQRGFPVLADDICALELRPEGPLVPPGPRHRLHPEEAKYLVPMADAGWCEVALLGRCYQLDPEAENGAEPSFAPLRGRDKLNAVLVNTCRRGFVEAMGRGGAYFEACSQLAQQVPIYTFRYRRDLGGLERLADRVAGHLAAES